MYKLSFSHTFDCLCMVAQVYETDVAHILRTSVAGFIGFVRVRRVILFRAAGPASVAAAAVVGLVIRK